MSKRRNQSSNETPPAMSLEFRIGGPLIRRFNLAELCLLVALPTGLGAAAGVQHEGSDKPDTDINAGILHAVRKGCTAGALPIVWLVTPRAYKKMTLKQEPCESPTRSRRLGCELRKGRCCRARRACVGCSRPIPDQMVYRVFSRSI